MCYCSQNLWVIAQIAFTLSLSLIEEYFCAIRMYESCESQVTSLEIMWLTQECRLRKLPPVLTFALLRFLYDFKRGERYKVSYSNHEGTIGCSVTKFRLCNNCRIRVNLNFHWNWTWHLTAAVVMATKREKRGKEEGERRYRTSSILLSYTVAVPTLATILPTLETSTTWAHGHTQLVRVDCITNDDVILQLHVLHHFYKPTCKTNNFLTAEHAYVHALVDSV